MAFYIRNISLNPVAIDDLGITLAVGEDYNLAKEYATDVAMSEDLRTVITNGEVAVLDPLDNTTQLNTAESLTVLDTTNSPPYRIKGGTLAQLDDVDVSGALNNYVIAYDYNTNTWKASPQYGGGGSDGCFPFWLSNGSQSNIKLITGQLPFYLSDGTAKYINVGPC